VRASERASEREREREKGGGERIGYGSAEQAIAKKGTHGCAFFCFGLSSAVVMVLNVSQNRFPLWDYVLSSHFSFLSLCWR
jgi:hypothetical protein